MATSLIFGQLLATKMEGIATLLVDSLRDFYNRASTMIQGPVSIANNRENLDSLEAGSYVKIAGHVSVNIDQG
jgi:archaellum component FlaG (FlaF/FlaG flagellin family)